jgi:phosphohistidine phosphatase
MKTLFLVRHAKSSWDDPALDDRQRPLAVRGRGDAPRLARRLAQRYRRPDLVLSSPAVRALHTAQLVARRFGCKHLVVDARLYGYGVRELLRVIHQLDDAHQRVMLFGHNPELTRLARRFSRAIHHLPTCVAARFKFDVKSWTRIGPRTLVGVALAGPNGRPDDAGSAGT